MSGEPRVWLELDDAHMQALVGAAGHCASNSLSYETFPLYLALHSFADHLLVNTWFYGEAKARVRDAD